MSWSFFIISFIGLFAWAYCIPLAEECSRNPTQCDEGTVCFQNSVWWSACHKKCPDGWGCNEGKIPCTKAVNDMEEEVKKLKDDERINGFAKAQLCIAEKSCTHKKDLDNPSWLDNVLNSFVQPYVEKAGKWNDVIDECRKLNDDWYVVPAAKYSCQDKMADYHISHDLQNALDLNGCGTEKDWEQIGEYIKSCVEEADMNILYSLFAKWDVINNRNEVRSKCIKYRNSSGQQIEF